MELRGLVKSKSFSHYSKAGYLWSLGVHTFLKLVLKLIYLKISCDLCARNLEEEDDLEHHAV